MKKLITLMMSLLMLVVAMVKIHRRKILKRLYKTQEAKPQRKYIIYKNLDLIF